MLYAEPPSAVRELAMTYRDQSSVRLQWLAPDSDGGREDLRYRVECVDCAGRGDDDVAYTPRQTDLRGTASVYSPLILVVVWQLLTGHSFFLQRSIVSTRERKCADTAGTVLVLWAGHFQS